MSKLNATAAINLAKSSVKWSNLKAHNHRNYYDMKHDKNKNINPTLSKYNIYHNMNPNNYYEFMDKFVDKDKLKKQRKKYLKRRQKSRARKFSSPKAFIRSKHHRNCRCGIITLGDHNFQNDLEDEIKKKNPGISIFEIKMKEEKILQHYIHNFNHRHKYIKIIAYAIHCDETFIHAHVEFMSVPGRTKGGKLRLNSNKAMRKEEATAKEISKNKLPKNNIALHRFQSEEDPLIIGSAHRDYGVDLVRKGNASKDDQRQHSLAVSASARASSYNSIANSSASYLRSLNTNYEASLSRSASSAVKAKKKSLRSSVSIRISSASASVAKDSDELVDQEATLISHYAPLTKSNGKPLNFDNYRYDARHGAWVNHHYQTGYQLVHHGLKHMNNLYYSLHSQVNTENNVANDLDKQNSKLNAKNKRLSDKNHALDSEIHGKKTVLDKLKHAETTVKSFFSREKSRFIDFIGKHFDTVTKQQLKRKASQRTTWRQYKHSSIYAENRINRILQSSAAATPTPSPASIASSRANVRASQSASYRHSLAMSAHARSYSVVVKRRERRRLRSFENTLLP